MNDLKLKVCGMRDPSNIKGLLELRPDFIGFIFYEKSPRYSSSLDEDLLSRIPLSIHKVGVFVNETIDTVVKTMRRYGLDYAQLHGDEDLDYAKKLRAKGIKIIKVFRVMDVLPVAASRFEGVVDYLLFDTASSAYGGSGRHFDWTILKNYNLGVPLLLSGGIAIEDIASIKSLSIPHLVGVDVNSRFEVEPGLKDLEMVKALKEVL